MENRRRSTNRLNGNEVCLFFFLRPSILRVVPTSSAAASKDASEERRPGLAEKFVSICNYYCYYSFAAVEQYG